jgi:hypothetical protein
MQTPITSRRRRRIRTGEMTPARQTDAARIRAGEADFLSSFARFQSAIEAACEGQDEWQAKVVAGVYAALECTAEHPRVGRALMIQARGEEWRVGKRQREAVVHFARVLRSVVPKSGRPLSADVGTVEAIATIIRGNLENGTAAELSSLGPDLIFLVLVPHVGVEEAQKWAESDSQGRR